MIISHKHRFIYLRTEKTGSTSLSNVLETVLGDEDIRGTMSRPAWARYSPIHHGALKRNFPQWFGLHTHATAKQVRQIVGKKIFDSYFKFAVERNPWDRQVSLYFHREWKKNNKNPDFDRDMRSAIYRNTEYCKLNNWSIYAIGNEVVVDRVLRYENLNNEITSTLHDLGIDIEIEMPRMRSYAPGRPHYSTYYTDWTRNLVAKWYAKDIEALGYTFETKSDDNTGLIAKPMTAAANEQPFQGGQAAP